MEYLRATDVDTYNLIFPLMTVGYVNLNDYNHIVSEAKKKHPSAHNTNYAIVESLREYSNEGSSNMFYNAKVNAIYSAVESMYQMLDNGNVPIYDILA